MRVLYSALMQVLGMVLWPLLWIKGCRDPDYRGRMAERFGYIPPVPGGVAVWVHAASVGEFVTALPLIEALLRRHGEGRVCVTTTTPTGSAQVRARLGARVVHCFAPLDVPSVVRRMLARLAPRQVVVMETELWPALFTALRHRNIPLVIANARLSPRSVRGYGRVAGLARSVLADVTLVAAQSDEHAARYRQLGAPRVTTLGNLKFDIAPDTAQVDDGRAVRRAWGERPVWIAASTHAPEEQVALDAHARIVARHPDAVLILVPRHPPRFTEVAAQVAASGLRWARRSRDDLPTDPPQVLLGDSMGEMWRYLALADVAFVGGSLAPVGGHNVLEPAALGIPVVFGPHMHNFTFARDLLVTAGGATQVADADALSQVILEWLDHSDRRTLAGAAARQSLVPHRGALQRLLTKLDDSEAGA
jgi:3-deoxy-D-manno-octulosonic-acid transferase